MSKLARVISFLKYYYYSQFLNSIKTQKLILFKCGENKIQISEICST